jgi:hypothetical protein
VSWVVVALGRHFTPMQFHTDQAEVGPRTMQA